MRFSTQATAGAIFSWTTSGKPKKRTVFAWAGALFLLYFGVTSSPTLP